MIKNFEINLSLQNGKINVNIIEKNIKNIHLKVYSNFKVNLSVPKNTEQDWIENFLYKKSDWIDKQITKYRLAEGTNNLLDIKTGTSTQFLGKDMRIYKNTSLNNEIVLEEKNINIYLKDIKDQEYANKFFNKWWRKQADLIFNEETNKLYQKIYKKYNINKPEVCIRKMKTQWGSCIQSKNKITLNEYLLKANRRCIQYVILHELTHLMYPYHNKDFYNFLTIQMPDWKQRKHELDNDVVQWL